MNILITGSNGFLAKELISRLEKNSKYTLYITNRQTLDILDPDAVEQFFSKNSIDIVLHCAVSGGRRTQSYTSDIVHKNILMFENLAQYRNRYKLMINFGTAAEFDKTKNIDQFTEHDFILHNNIPKDYYGFSKYIIARRIDHINSNIINLRIFNVFGEFEALDRMIKNNIIKYLKRQPLEIHRNRYMDFFGPNDMFTVVEYILNNTTDILDQLKHFFMKGKITKSINMCYEKKHSLMDVASIINSLNEHTVPLHGMINIASLQDPAYCGNGAKLSSLNLKLLGLEQEINNMYQTLKRSYE